MSQIAGFIGVGAMGLPMAGRLIAQDYELIVHDVRKEIVDELVQRGATTAASPAEVASAVDTVLVSLPTPDVVAEVALGADGLIHGSTIKTFVDLSTTGPSRAIEIAEALKAAGITAIDAPVSGGVSGAEAGSLAVMMSGPEEICAQLMPLLQAIGKNVFQVGTEPGQGQMMKLLNNLLSAAALAVSCEAMVLGAKSGLDPQVMVDVIKVSSGRNSAIDDKIPNRILSGSFGGGFTMELMTKDLRLCLEQAEALGVPMWVAQAVRQMWSFAQSQSEKNADTTTIINLIEEWADIKVPRSG